MAAAALPRLRRLARLDELIVRLEVRLSEYCMELEGCEGKEGWEAARLRARARLAERGLARLDERRRALLAGLDGPAASGPAADERGVRGPRRG